MLGIHALAGNYAEQYAKEHNCPNLRSVQMPSTVTAIERGAFGGVNKLEISVAEKMPSIHLGKVYFMIKTVQLCCVALRESREP